MPIIRTEKFQELFRNLLTQDAFFAVNKKLAREIGIEAALILSDLIQKDGYFRDRDQLEDDFFYNTHENIEKDTTLSKHKQNKAIKILVGYGLLTVKRKGMPSKNHFKIGYNELLNILNDLSVKNLTTGRKENERQDVENFNANKNKLNNNKLNKNKQKKGQFFYDNLNNGLKIPDNLDTIAFIPVWDNWVRHRLEIKKPLTATTVQAQLKMLSNQGWDNAIEIIGKSILNGWQGLFPNNDKKEKQLKQYPSYGEVPVV